MICLICNHYTHPDRELDRVQGSVHCRCECHPWNHDHELVDTQARDDNNGDNNGDDDDRETIAEGDARYYRTPGAADR